MGEPLKVLILEDSEDDADLTVNELERGGYEPIWKRVDSEEGLLKALKDQDWEVMLADFRLSKK